MGKPHPIELRERVVAFVEEGHSHRSAAAHFRVSPRFVNALILRKKATGTLAPMRQGHAGTNSKLRPHEDWLRHRLAENGELTLDELRCELSARGVEVHRSSVGRFLKSLGLSNKKNAASKRAQASGHCGSARTVARPT